ncbi:hypothetical protein L7F22_049641 [Adiantum nelumboides]|nr:hypothetical protein [Adiantum nelumboides]
MATSSSGVDNARVFRRSSESSGRLSGKRFSVDNVVSPSASMQREIEEEEALRCAAPQKLPTYDRLRRAVLSRVMTEGSVQYEEVDVTKLALADKQQLIQKILRVAEEDNERLLLKLWNRIDKVGIDLPKIEVRFEHLNISADVYVGSRALPTLLNFTVNYIQRFLSCLHLASSRKHNLTILHDVSGIIKPSRMTLLLGPPGSGKTTLLLAIAGKLDPNLRASGGVTYNGHDLREFVPQRTAAYISQHDLQIGEMTVRETLDFCGRCQGVGSRYDMLMELLRREREAGIKPDPDMDMFMKATAVEGAETSLVTDYILKKILALDICADALVGDEMRRGISGGQKKRLTTGEMLVGPAKALFMDEISTGLDSSTTFQIVKCLHQSVHVMDGTMLVSLFQPAPETFELFDDIILLSEGQVVYQGPRELVEEFFEHMSFKCPERKSVADFLQEVTSRKDQQQYWADKSRPYFYVPVVEFAQAFNNFHVGQCVSEILSRPYDKSKSHPASFTTRKYGLDKWELLRACFAREWLLMKRNVAIYVFKTVQISLVAVIAMTVFLRTTLDHETIIEFFRQFFVLFLIHQMSLGLFRTIAAVGRNTVVSNTFGTFILVVVFSCGGFVVSKDNIPKWWVWGYWVSPLMYGQNAIAVNEFTASRWAKPNTDTSIDASTIGTAVLKSRGLSTSLDRFWIGTVSVCGFIVLFYVLFTLALIYLNPLSKPQALLSEEALEEKHVNRTGESKSNSSKRRVSLDHTLAIERNAGGSKPPMRRSGVDLLQRIPSARSNDDHVEGVDAEAAGVAPKTGMILPSIPLSIAFDNVNYYVDMPAEMKQHGVQEDRLQLLQDVCGAFRPGVLTALVGVSGAGKTTLMDVLAGRKTGGYIEGSISISGYPKRQESFARISGYCK